MDLRGAGNSNEPDSRSVQRALNSARIENLVGCERSHLVSWGEGPKVGGWKIHCSEYL